MGVIDVEATPLAGLVIARTRPHADHRGAFARLFCADDLGPVWGDRRIAQINHSLTRSAGAIRGMHFQNAPHAEMKVVRCLRGRVFDVAVDLRRRSPTFLQWHGTELAGGDCRAFVIPEGFAHGFQVLEPDSELLYLHSVAYTPTAEQGVSPLDPRLGILWPLPVGDMSERDKGHPPIGDAFAGVSE